MIEPACGARLDEEARANPRRAEQVRVDELHCDRAIERPLQGAVDDAHPARAQPLDDLEATGDALTQELVRRLRLPLGRVRVARRGPILQRAAGRAEAPHVELVAALET